MNLEKLKKYRKLLEQWSNANASFAIFTHKNDNIFLVNLGGITNKPGVTIGFTKCTRTTGPTRWENANLEIDFNKNNSTLRISDKSSDFSVECEDMYIGNDLDDIIE